MVTSALSDEPDTPDNHYEFDVRNAIDQWSLFDHYQRAGMDAGLSSAAMHVLNFIFLRTIRYGKFSEVISHRHFLEGVIDKADRSITAPVRVSRRHLSRAIAEVVATGLVTVQDEPRQYLGRTFNVRRYTLPAGAKVSIECVAPSLRPWSVRSVRNVR